MLDDPGLDSTEIHDELNRSYAVSARSMHFIRSYEPDAASYEMDAADGRYFLKVRFGAVDEPSLEVPRALLEAGVPNILAPIRTNASSLTSPMGDARLVLYPFVSGRSAMVAGMTDDEWRTFGATLRAVHDSGLERTFGGRLPTDSFALPSAGSVRKVLGQEPAVESGAAAELHRFFGAQRERVGEMLERAEELGEILRKRHLPKVLCHADIHAANILVAEAGGIFLVDWDGPMIAPRERDLLFVIGSRIARDVTASEETLFFGGYGEVEVDREAIVYYRYERILEDIAVDAASVLTDPTTAESTRQAQVDMIAGFFAPGGMLETAESA